MRGNREAGASTEKIVYVSAARPESGTAHAIYVENLLNALRDLGKEAILVAPSHWRQRGKGEPSLGYVAIRCHPPARLRYYLMALRLGVFGVPRAARAPGATYVTHNPLFALALLCRGNRVVYDMHHMVRTKLGAFITRRIVRHMRCVGQSVISSGMLQRLAAIGAVHQNAVIRRNGASPAPSGSQDERRPEPRPEFTVMYSGSLAPERGVDILADVAQALPPTIRFEIFGGSVAETERLNRLLYERGVRERFVLHGKLSHDVVTMELQRADALLALYTSRVTNVLVMCPMKLIEYFAQGRPIIAADFPTIQELVVDRVNGLLYVPENASSLAAAISLVASDSVLSASLAASARRSAALLSWTRNAEQLLECAAASCRRSTRDMMRPTSAGRA